MLKKLLNKFLNRETITYLIIGVCTTVLSYGIYFLLFNKFSMSAGLSNLIANVISILFAYITNSRIVFLQKFESIKKELSDFIRFCLSRAVTFLIEEISLIIFVDTIGLDGNITKIVLGVLVIIFNYIFSKFFVFKKK